MRHTRRTQPAGLYGPISDYVRTHCGTCAAGWTRTGEKGQKTYICLLNREPVWPQMTDCDRYELRDDSKPEPDE